MNAHILMCNINYALIQGKQYTTNEIDKFNHIFLESISDSNTIQRFQKGVRALADNRYMYPLFYIPPFNNGKKFHTLNGILPKTQIYAANSYELEILRILCLFSKNKPIVTNMIETTKNRLQSTCFGNYCSVGECFETSMVVL